MRRRVRRGGGSGLACVCCCHRVVHESPMAIPAGGLPPVSGRPPLPYGATLRRRVAAAAADPCCHSHPSHPNSCVQSI